MNKRGLTLIELGLVIIIITIVTTLIISIYKSIAEKSVFSVAKSNLAILQKQIWLFYNVEGRYPNSLDELVAAGYIKVVPVLNIKYHPPSDEVVVASHPYDGKDDIGKWYYDNVNGLIVIACTHRYLDGIQIYKW